MPRENRRIQFTFVLVALLVLAVGGAAGLAIRRTDSPDYWVAVAAVVVPVALTAAGQTRRPSNRYSVTTPESEAAILRSRVVKQWE